MAATHELIATGTLNSGNPRVVFSSIPATYTDLQIVGCFMGSVEAYVGVQFNGDTGTNYSSTFWANRDAGKQSTNRIAGGPTYSATANDTCAVLIDINSYAQTNKYKTARVRNASAGADSVIFSEGVWRNTAAISSIDIWSQTGNNYAAGTSISLYGIKAL